jgi:SAM-dependent methyltransferase
VWLHVRDRQGPVKLFTASVVWAAEKSPRSPDVHFVGTPHEVVEIMLRLADVKQTDVVYDLGSGDGRIVIAAAKKAGCRAYGFDLDPEMVEQSIRNVKKEKMEALVTIKQKDIFDLDLSQASVVTLYLLPELNVALIPQLEKMKPGSRIVSHNFDMEGVDPDVEATVHRKDGKSNKVYLWTTPLKKPRPHILRKLLFGK